MSLAVNFSVVFGIFGFSTRNIAFASSWKLEILDIVQQHYQGKGQNNGKTP